MYDEIVKDKVSTYGFL